MFKQTKNTWQLVWGFAYFWIYFKCGSYQDLSPKKYSLPKNGRVFQVNRFYLQTVLFFSNHLSCPFSKEK